MTHTAFPGSAPGDDLIALAIDEHERLELPRLRRLWAYYRNPLRAVSPDAADRSARPWYRQAQEAGLPARLTGRPCPGMDDRAAQRREVVIENDIAWRIQTMIDFMLARPITLVSTARDETTRRDVERALDAVWEASGGISLLQDAALLGHVYGHVDLLLRVAEPQRLRASGALDAALRWSDAFRVELIDPTRGIPILDPSDYRALAAYIITFERELNAVEPARRASVPPVPPGRPGARPPALAAGASRRRSRIVEVFTPERRRLYDNGRAVERAAVEHTGGRVPVVHIQNMSQPLRYTGLSEVEPLIPLQDELNTRLSDRASRVTMQSFKMYLARGIDGFERASVGPGQIWSTDNEGATIQEFGGDASSPSEESHIAEVREALDKVSGVPPLAGGVIRAKIGNLSSANALKITLMGILSKTARKRVAYGRGIAEMSRLILTALDGAGLLATDPADRDIRIQWPDPLPHEPREETQAAESKVRLGVPRDRVLAELGYAPADPGIT